jgi:hypothetical protein
VTLTLKWNKTASVNREIEEQFLSAKEPQFQYQSVILSSEISHFRIEPAWHSEVKAATFRASRARIASMLFSESATANDTSEGLVVAGLRNPWKILSD